MDASSTGIVVIRSGFSVVTAGSGCFVSRRSLGHRCFGGGLGFRLGSYIGGDGIDLAVAVQILQNNIGNAVTVQIQKNGILRLCRIFLQLLCCDYSGGSDCADAQYCETTDNMFLFHRTGSFLLAYHQSVCTDIIFIIITSNRQHVCEHFVNISGKA